MTTMQTPLTRQQLTQLTQEYQTLEEWTTIRDFASQVYGPERAAKVEVETYGEYNDEGGTNYSVSAVTAYDANGEGIEFDLTLPFWTQSYFAETFQGKTDVEEALEAALDALKEYYPYKPEGKALLEQQRWVQWEDLPVDEHNGGDKTYDLTMQPSISFPVVFAGVAS